MTAVLSSVELLGQAFAVFPVVLWAETEALPLQNLLLMTCL